MNKGLYIHVPFCDRKCNYCAFYSIVDQKKKKPYLEEVKRRLLSFRGKGISIDTLYFGGGTPSLLEGEEVKSVIECARESFSLSPNAEITLEGNPDSLSKEKLTLFREAGVNRLSVGAESFSDDVLTLLGRRNDSAEVKRVIKDARACGFSNISLDLIYSLPLEFHDDFSRSLVEALALQPDHISLYALSVEEKTVFSKMLREGRITPLDEEGSADEYFRACEILRNAGFEHYEVSNFAKDGKRSRHNMKYWLAEEYIGLGAGAHSYFEGKRFSSAPSVDRFLSGTDLEESYENTLLDRAEETVFLSLRLSDGLDLERLEKEFSVSPTDEFLSVVRSLTEGGFATFDGKILSLTEKGFFVEGTICEKIINSLNFPLDF